MSTLAQPFIEYLEQLQRKGETHVHLDEQAKLVLREFYMRAKGIKPAARSAAPAQTTDTVTAQENTAVISTPEEPPAADTISITGNTAAEKIASLRQLIEKWTPIQSLQTLRDKLVFSSGDPAADLMFIGEAPGYHDERKQQPFSGPAGDKLDGILRAMGLKREDIYLSHIVKYRPAMENQTTGNRKPSHAEIQASLPLILEEIKIVSPKAIVILGATAAEAILETSLPIKSLRGKPHPLAGSTARVTYHPSYLLNNHGNEAKRQLWEDMLATMELLQMPITEKQRGYFKSK